MPYLRVRGDPGSGKTRFLLTVGCLCHERIFASGASTVSPLFRLLDTFRGTLVIDEGDFRLSDEKAEVVKILNNGNGKGFPVLRSEVSRQGEYGLRAYAVFGPNLVATRGYFEDRALESRCLTEEMGRGRLRDDIPINEPNEAKEGGASPSEPASPLPLPQPREAPSERCRRGPVDRTTALAGVRAPRIRDRR